MSAIDDRFKKLRSAGKKAFLPFVTAGDPSLPMTARLLEKLSACGSAIAEVGIPYSDPIADGPVIQASYTRALNAGIKLKDIFATVREVSPRLQMPLVSMVSYAVIHRLGMERYVSNAQAAGFSGAIVPDLLAEEADELRKICRREDFSLIHLVTPTTSPERMLRIADLSSGFVILFPSQASRASATNCHQACLKKFRGYASASRFQSVLASVSAAPSTLSCSLPLPTV